MINERDVFVVRFKKLATQFESFSDEYPDPDAMAADRAETEAGELIVAAYNRGYLSLPGLAKLVDWVENPPEPPEGATAWYGPCPSNLFIEVCGFHKWPVRLEGGKVAEVTGDATGGIIPDMLPESPALNRPTREQSPKSKKRQLLDHYAMTCLLLANAIERSSPLDARDRWIYDHAIMGRTWKWIVDNIPDWCPDREQIMTVTGAKKAAERYALKNDLPEVPKRSPGRRGK